MQYITPKPLRKSAQIYPSNNILENISVETSFEESFWIFMVLAKIIGQLGVDWPIRGKQGKLRKRALL